MFLDVPLTHVSLANASVDTALAHELVKNIERTQAHTHIRGVRTHGRTRMYGHRETNVHTDNTSVRTHQDVRLFAVLVDQCSLGRELGVCLPALSEMRAM